MNTKKLALINNKLAESYKEVGQVKITLNITQSVDKIEDEEGIAFATDIPFQEDSVFGDSVETLIANLKEELNNLGMGELNVEYVTSPPEPLVN